MRIVVRDGGGLLFVSDCMDRYVAYLSLYTRLKRYTSEFVETMGCGVDEMLTRIASLLDG